MARTKLEIAIAVVINLCVAAYLVNAMFPTLRLQLENQTRPLRWYLWRYRLRPYLREAYQVRGMI